jgi:PadR family transcriptional regulator, regulatory protein PadR
MNDRELKKGSAPLLILSLLEEKPCHGYSIAKLIEERSGGKLRFHVASLYPALYGLEKQGMIRGSWEQGPNRRRKRYRITAAGRKVLQEQKRTWAVFWSAVERVTGVRYA